MYRATWVTLYEVEIRLSFEKVDVQNLSPALYTFSTEERVRGLLDDKWQWQCQEPMDIRTAH